MSKSKAQNRKHHPFLLVGVGAAAGGLEAFAEFLKAIGDCPGLAVVYFQHAEPNWHPLSTTLLSSSTSLPLVRLSGRHELKPNTVYFAPTNQRVEIVGNQLIATELSHEESAASPIDHFFNQVSLSYGEHAVGVVLSGAGSDGTLGLKSISDRGGMTFAQSPESAQFDAMPRSAATIGVADHVLPPADIAKELLRYARYLADHYQIAGKVSETDQIENAIPRITDILMRETDHNFRHYKINTLCRRLQRRMHVLQIGQVEDYVKRIDTDKTELHNLFRELLIGVTAFFRDPIAFERLAEKVIPELFANRKPDEVVRIWVPGCATGEEAYSMAILCREWIEAHNIEYAVQIFASDIDELALSTARKGIYPIGIEDQVSSERLEKYFIKKGKRYHIASKVRENGGSLIRL